MPVHITDKTQCCGCASCASICPWNCIRMMADECGFEYPVVNGVRCTDCGLCLKVCPLQHPENKEAAEPISVNAAWSKDDGLRFESTSGGVFSELAFYVIEQGGAAAGAAYDENNDIRHTIVFKKEDVALIRQSKYAQSEIGDVYREIRKLVSTRPVLFCGTPCQVAGLLRFFGKVPENLITVDFICRGMNSPKAYRAYLQEIEDRYHAKVSRVWFKYKIDGWKKSPRCTRIDLKNGKKIIQKRENNPFMYGYLGPNLYIRPSCSDCKYKGSSRVSDITVGDFWEVDSSLDNDRGTSMLQINTPKGGDLIEAVSDRIEIHRCRPEDIKRGNTMMDSSVRINPASKEFLKALGGRIPFSRLVYRYSGQTAGEKVKFGIKRTLRFLGIYR